MRRVIIAVPAGVEILDLAGPMQVFYEAASAGAPYRVSLVADAERIESEQGVGLCGLQPLPKDTGSGDLIIVPGSTALRRSVLARDRNFKALTTWLRASYDAGATVTSVCVGAFALAAAGLLDGRTATTHWKRVDELARAFPRVRVEPNRLYVIDGRIATSAGVASGVDLALALVERDCGSPPSRRARWSSPHAGRVRMNSSARSLRCAIIRLPRCIASKTGSSNTPASRSRWHRSRHWRA